MAESWPDYVSPNHLDNATDLICSTQMHKSFKLNGIYDQIYHWDCISQPFAVNILGKCVSEWEVLEE
jgi:hypothetical protein